jgi:hypothetical protein
MSSYDSPLNSLQSASKNTTSTIPLVSRIIRNNIYDQMVENIATSKQSCDVHDNNLVTHDYYNVIQ